MGHSFERSVESTAPVDLVYPSEGDDDTKSGINYLLKGFRETHPDVPIELEMVSADIVGLEVKTRVLRERSPDVWLEWPGRNVRPYQDADVLLDLTDLWESTDMERAYLDGPKRAAQFNGCYRAVPLTIHRANSLFYNTELIEHADLEPEGITTSQGFVDALETVASTTDAVPLALPMQNPWPVLQFWETLLLAEHGPRVYRSILDGAAHRNRDAIRGTLELLDQFTAYTAEDTLYCSLMDESHRFRDGEVAFFPQGDWVGGILEGEGMAYQDGWDHTPFPGTEGLYSIVMDALVAAADTDAPESTRTFLEYAGTAEAQVLFNQHKGSIPPRGDVSMDAFSPFLQQQQRDFKRSTEQPFSIAHGLGVTPTQFVELKSAIVQFLTERDMETAADELVDIFARE